MVLRLEDIPDEKSGFLSEERRGNQQFFDELFLTQFNGNNFVINFIEEFRANWLQFFA